MSIPSEIFAVAETLMMDVDPDDTEHAALTIFAKAKLWTGDKKLAKGLMAKRIDWVISTAELFSLRQSLEK